ncbi:MAG: helix-turn-helix domain-containing protein [Planctomycetes bacterium]|nr:helix-turn-helix domain-containing protein [Planctomycetota bacterium]
MRTTSVLEQDALDLAVFMGEQGNGPILTAHEAAQLAKMSHGRFIAALNEGRVRGHRSGSAGHWRISLLDLARFVVGLTPT